MNELKSPALKFCTPHFFMFLYSGEFKIISDSKV